MLSRLWHFYTASSTVTIRGFKFWSIQVHQNAVLNCSEVEWWLSSAPSTMCHALSALALFSPWSHACRTPLAWWQAKPAAYVDTVKLVLQWLCGITWSWASTWSRTYRRSSCFSHQSCFVFCALSFLYNSYVQLLCWIQLGNEGCKVLATTTTDSSCPMIQTNFVAPTSPNFWSATVHFPTGVKVQSLPRLHPDFTF